MNRKEYLRDYNQRTKEIRNKQKREYIQKNPEQCVWQE